jgi:hypothetical protein
MTIFDNRKTNGARDEDVAPHRPCAQPALLDRSNVATLSFARGLPRGPPIAG